MVSDYIQLEGNASSTYKLYSTSELGDIELPPAPKAPVYPPEFPRGSLHQCLPFLIYLNIRHVHV